MSKAADPLGRLRKIALALPEAHEVRAWGEPTFRVKNKLFAMFAAAENHHGGGRPAAWIKAEDGEQELLIAADADRYFKPPYVGPSGWVGVRLDRGVDWDAVEELLEIGWRLTAPKKLLAARIAPESIEGAPPAKRDLSPNSSKASKRRPRTPG